MHSRSPKLALCLLAVACCLASCSSESGPTPVGSVSGHVYDMAELDGVPGVDVSIGGSATSTDNEGYFFLTPEAGTQTVVADDESYVRYESSMTVTAGQLVDIDIEICPLPATRFVLIWGDDPPNLDAHAWVPMGTGTFDHIWREDFGGLDRPPYTRLDEDTTNGHGPETVFIYPGAGDYYEGWHHFAVQHVGGGSTLPESDARVEIYRGNQLRETIELPPGSALPGWYWFVGKLNCRTMDWVEVGEYSEDAPLPDA